MVFTAKHLLNSSATLVTDALQGLALLNPQLQVDKQNKVVYCPQTDRGRVALISGGGAGHEPAHAGFVGDGILAAAVSGNVFASPSASQVKRAIELVDNEKGTLIIIKNYTGDILNFGLAREQYLASNPTKAANVKFLVVGDDVAVGRTQGNIVGRRGLAGTVLVYKIAGALSRQGGSLDEVYTLAKWVSENIATIGVGSEHCHVPGTKVGESHLSQDAIELGMGIHNEPGFQVLSPIPTLDTLIPRMLDLIFSTSDPERSFLPFTGKDEIVLLLNNLGGMSELEMSGVLGQLLKELEKRGINVKRVLSGAFMTSLNMPGFSITVLLLPSASRPGPANLSTDKILSYLDEPTSTPGWRWSAQVIPPAPSSVAQSSATTAAPAPTSQSPKVSAPNPEAFNQAIARACAAVMAAEPEITRLDTVAGDGDAGLTLKRGAEGVLALGPGINGADVISTIRNIARAVSEHMDGTSGALYSIFFSALAQSLHSTFDKGPAELNATTWSQSLTPAFNTLLTYTRARPPSRTLIDPLSAFVLALEKGTDVAGAVKAASDAAEATKKLEAKAGRAAYVDAQRVVGEADPGAWGVKTILEAMIKST